MTNAWITLILLALSSLSTLVESQNICPLCETAADLPKRWDYEIPDGRTCRDIYLYLGDMSSSNSLCQATKNIAQELCCGDTEPPDSGNGGNTGPPEYTGQVGDEPICPICGTYEYPGLPNAFIVARYVGAFTCGDLYGRGLHGMTPGYMCGALQDFSRPVCGCGEYNPRCLDNPNNCFGQPGYNNPTSPVRSPVRQPTPRPVWQPAQRPVWQPTNVEPTIFNRKTPPEGGKYSTKLSSSRGGAAQSSLRGGRRGEETELIEVSDEHPQERKLDFRVVESYEEQLDRA